MAKDITIADLIKPMPGLVVIQVDTRDEITPSGLMIPRGVARSIHESRATHGVVVAVAIGDEIDDDLLLGDHVFFGKFTGSRIECATTVDGQRSVNTAIVMQRRDILGIIRPTEGDITLTVKA